MKDADFYFWVTLWIFTLNPSMHPTSITVRHSFTTTTNFESTTPSGTAFLSKQFQQRKTLFTLLCESVCVGWCVRAYEFTCMWRLQVNIECLPQLLFILF